MNRITPLLAGLLMAGTATFAFAQEGKHNEAAEGQTVTITGELIDTACFVASDGGAKGKGHAQCAQKCMASGIPAGVLPEGAEADGMLFLLTNPQVLAQYAAKTVKVEGVKHDKMHAIDVKRISVKQDDGSFKEVKLSDEHHNMAGGDKKAADGDHAGHGHD